MQWIQIIIFVLLLSGFFTLFDIRFTDLLNLLAVGKKSTLNDDIDVLLGKPAKGFFNRESVEIEQLLKSTGRENRFTMVKRMSVLLFSLGAVVSLLLNNPFLIPVLGAGFALAPVWYLRSTAFERRAGNCHLRSNNFLSAKRRPDESRKREYPILKSTCEGKL